MCHDDYDITIYDFEMHDTQYDLTSMLAGPFAVSNHPADIDVNLDIDVDNIFRDWSFVSNAVCTICYCP